MAVRLQQAGFLKRRDDAAVFLRATVCTGVHFVRHDTEDDRRNGERVQYVKGPESTEESRADGQNLPVSCPQRALQKAARREMVLLIFPDCVADNRPFRIAIPVLQPVDHAGNKVREQEPAQHFEQEHACCCNHRTHHDCLLTCYRAFRIVSERLFAYQGAISKQTLTQ